MIHINETQSAGLISHQMAFAAITRALIAAASPDSSIFPVMLGHAGDPQNRFTIKSGTDADLTGLKIGSYFPTNDRLGLPRHDSVKSKGLPAEASRAEQACASADVIVTATLATAPLFHAQWVRAGTHISSMGSDATGKQELPPDLFHKARLFCDLPEQSRRIGEFQHADAKVQLTAIGDVLSGKARGRVSADDITIFDSSGISLQDLYIAQAIIKAHLECRT
jgi:ornithine cyclodeaminase